MCELDMDAQFAPNIVEVDRAAPDNDSSYGEEISTFTRSLSTSVLKYEWKHGRRYHSYRAGIYKFPNDEREQARLDLCHHIYYILLDEQLFMAPIRPDGMRILDIGTGTGMWPIQMADAYPSAELVGNDLSPIQPHLVPPNVRFIVDDVEQPWAETRAFDYIHCRYMTGSIRDWPSLMQQCYQNLKPGGWVEFQEYSMPPYSEDDTLQPDNKLVQMLQLLAQACECMGRTLNPAPYLRQWVQDAGFVNVEQHVFKLPVGSWPKNKKLKLIGSLMAIHYIDGVDGFTLSPFTEILGWSRADVEVLNNQVREAIQTRGIHALHNYYVVYAQKPLF